MKIKTQKTIKQAAGSYVRAALSAVIAYYMATGDMDLRALASAALAAIIGPAARWANPKDSLGR